MHEQKQFIRYPSFMLNGIKRHVVTYCLVTGEESNVSDLLSAMSLYIENEDDGHIRLVLTLEGKWIGTWRTSRGPSCCHPRAVMGRDLHLAEKLKLYAKTKVDVYATSDDDISREYHFSLTVEKG